MINIQEGKPDVIKRVYTWRIMKMIIFLRNNIFRAIRLLKLVPFAAQDAGSIVKAYRQTRFMFKQHGFKAVKLHWRLLELNRDFKMSFIKGQEIIVLATPHTLYVANLIQNALEQINIKANIILKSQDGGFSNNWHIVICPQMFERMPKHYIAFQMEQSVSSRWFTEAYLDRLKNAYAVFDYSFDNIVFLQKHDIPFRQLFYMPIAYLDNMHNSNRGTQRIEYDVLFYGDVNSARRKAYLERLQQKYKIKIVDNLFGEDLHKELQKAKVIINIHYYEGALLETTRIYECLSQGSLVVSEASTDLQDHSKLQGLVDFVEIGDIEQMVECVGYWLSDESRRQERLTHQAKILRNTPSWFDFYFYSFLLAHDLIRLDLFYQLTGQHPLPLNNFRSLI